MIRTSVRRIGLVVVVLLVLGLVLVMGLRLAGARALERELDRLQQEVGSLDPASYETAAPGPENAGYWLWQGAEALTTGQEDRGAVGRIVRVPVAEWDAEQAEVVRRVVAEQAEGLDTLHRAAAVGSTSFGLRRSEKPGDGTHAMLVFVNAARLLAAEAELSFYDGRSGDALVPAAALGRLAGGLQHEPSAVGIIGVAAERMLVGLVADAVADPMVSDGIARRLAAALPVEDPVTLAARRIASDGASIAALHRKQAGSGARLWEHPFAPFFGAAIFEGYRKVHRSADVPFAERDLEEVLGPRPAWYERGRRFMWRFVAPGLMDTIARAQVLAAERQLVLGAVAVREVGREVGDYPAQRPPLELLRRPDPFRGKLIEYERLDDGTARLSLPGGVELANEVSPRLQFLGEVTLPPL